MKTKIIRVLVVLFGLSALGSLSITPTVRGQLTEEQKQNKRQTQLAIQEKKDYDAGYNEGYMRAREEEQKRIDAEEANQGSACCGGGGQQSSQ